MSGLRVELDAAAMRVRLVRVDDVPSADWWFLVKDMVLGVSADAREEGAAISAPWHAFLQTRAEIGGALAQFDVEVTFDDAARTLLVASRRNETEFETAATAPPLAEADVLAELKDAGFVRTLNDHQRANVAKLGRMASGADFSVPGAGKTTEALAFFALRAKSEDRLLVVAPINAFAAWEREHFECFGDNQPNFVRLRGGVDAVEALLAKRPRFAIVNYESLPNLRDRLGAYVGEGGVFVFLDESHRIKSGEEKIRAEAALSLAPRAAGRLIMSGTPMPQASQDLIPQVRFLFPELTIEPEGIVDAIRPVFVRTTKSDLGLPTPQRIPVPIAMAEGQARLYALLTSEFVRQAEGGLDVLNRQALRRLGRSVMRLLQVVSNPALVAEQLEGAHAELLSQVLADGDSPKLAYAVDRARALAPKEKVLIWSTFRQNVEVIADRLRDVGAVFIHGGVGPGDEDDLERREGRIKAFKEQNDVRVLVANPATAAEGISLHNICQVAIYVDRTYNAAHYMQSEDRIVRLGLKKGVVPRMEILECVNSIDERVHERLRQKINAMSDALNDPSIRLDPVDAPIDPDVIENEDERTLGMTKADAADLLASLKS